MSRTISEEAFRSALAALAEIADRADRMKREVERLDPVEVHRDLEKIASGATIVGLYHLRASAEEWREAAPGSEG